MMENSFLSLKWNNRQSTWAQCLADFRHKEFYTDATLTCEGRFFSVHKLILSMCSDYFREIFQRTYCKCPVVVLKGVRPNELSALIDYMYNGEVEVRQNEVTEFMNAAQTLGIKSLTGPNPNLQTKYSKKTTPVKINEDTSCKIQKTVSDMVSVEPVVNNMSDQNDADVHDSDTQINPSIVLVETVRSEEAQRAFATVSYTCDNYALNVQDRQINNDIIMEDDSGGNDMVAETPSFPDNITVALREAYQTNLSKIRKKQKRKRVAVIKVDSRQRRSDVWNHFKISQGNKAQCNHCKKTYEFKDGGTSNLRKHLRCMHATKMAK